MRWFIMKQKSTAFLKFIIIYKSLVGIVSMILAFGFYHLLNKDTQVVFTKLVKNLNLDIDNKIISSLIKQVGTLGNGAILSLTFVMLGISVLNLVEAWGLHLKRRWAEWLTVIATSLLIPFEVYHVLVRVKFFKVSILILNVVIVYYLAKHKELFKSKKKAVSEPEARLEEKIE